MGIANKAIRFNLRFSYTINIFSKKKQNKTRTMFGNSKILITGFLFGLALDFMNPFKVRLFYVTNE